MISIRSLPPTLPVVTYLVQHLWSIRSCAMTLKAQNKTIRSTFHQLRMWSNIAHQTHVYGRHHSQLWPVWKDSEVFCSGYIRRLLPSLLSWGISALTTFLAIVFINSKYYTTYQLINFLRNFKHVFFKTILWCYRSLFPCLLTYYAGFTHTFL